MTFMLMSTASRQMAQQISSVASVVKTADILLELIVFEKVNEVLFYAFDRGRKKGINFQRELVVKRLPSGSATHPALRDDNPFGTHTICLF